MDERYWKLKKEKNSYQVMNITWPYSLSNKRMMPNLYVNSYFHKTI